jgi:hypothetical protein
MGRWPGTEGGDCGGQFAGVREIRALDFLPPVTVRTPSRRLTPAPISARMLRQRSPTCCVSSGQSGIRTVPPEARAAARNGPALDRSCSICWSKARMGPGATNQWFGTESSTATPAPRRTATVMLMWSRLGTGLPTCSRCSPSVNRAPTNSRAETNCDEALASMTRWPPRTSPEPSTTNGKDDGVPPSSADTATPSAFSASMMVPMGRLRACGSPSNTLAPLRSAASGGTNRITVPARPQSIVAADGAASARSGDLQIRPESAVPRYLGDGGAELPERLDHQCGVPGMQRCAQPRRAVGECRQHQIPVGQRLRARHGDGGIHRAGGEGGGPVGEERSGVVPGGGGWCGHVLLMPPWPVRRRGARPCRLCAASCSVVFRASAARWHRPLPSRRPPGVLHARRAPACLPCPRKRAMPRRSRTGSSAAGCGGSRALPCC